jgi:carboxymethylenebutenolidase
MVHDDATHTARTAMTYVSIRTRYGEMRTYTAEPPGPGPWPGVVVLHDFLGMSHDLRHQVDWLASGGYLAAAPDLYYWGSRLRCLRTIMRDIGARRGRTFDDIDATRRWCAAHARCTGRVGVIGFCMGGGYALLLAPDHGYAAASVNYGGCPDDAETVLAGACPIVGSYGGQDRSRLGGSAPLRLKRALTTLGVDHDIKTYPEAGHAFLNDHDPADVPAWLDVVSKLSRTGYHAPSAADARRRIVAFFDRHLKSG